jgi:hypothetical protein
MKTVGLNAREIEAARRAVRVIQSEKERSG